MKLFAIVFLASTLTLASGASLNNLRRRHASKSDLIHHEYHGPPAPLSKDGRVIDTPEVMKARADHLAIHAETVVDLKKKMAEANSQNEEENKYERECDKEKKKEEEKKETEIKVEEVKKEKAAPIVVAPVEVTPELMSILTATTEEKKEEEETKPVKEANAEEAPVKASEVKVVENSPTEEATPVVNAQSVPVIEEEKKEEEEKEEEKKEEDLNDEKPKQEEQKKEEEKAEEKKEEVKKEENNEEVKEDEKKEEEIKEEEEKEEEKKEKKEESDEKKEEKKEKKEEEKEEKRKREEKRKGYRNDDTRPVVETVEANEVDHENPIFIHYYRKNYEGPLAPLGEDGRVLDTPEVRKAKEAHLLAYEYAVKLAKAQTAAEEGSLPVWYEMRKRVPAPTVKITHSDGPIGYNGPTAPIDNLGRVIDTEEVERVKTQHRKAHEQAIELAKLRQSKTDDNSV